MSDSSKVQPIDLNPINTYELASRPSKVTVSDFGKPFTGESFAEFVGSLPTILGADTVRAVADAVVRARELGKPVIWGIGGHVIKTGLAPVLIDLMNQGFVSAIAGNGSVLVHDSEIAMVGYTSEDVDATIGEGDFGAARETGELLNHAASVAAKGGEGLGSALAAHLAASSPKFSEYSLLCAADRLGIPFTAHLTIGADIGHFHPTADGSALGASSHTDFRKFCSLVREMNGGGVYLNIGSAVTMPEIFLKAVTVVRNLGNELRDITTANFDFLQHYRPLTNVVRRPTANGAGKGYSVTGHHEIMIPMLAAMIKT